MGACKPSPEYSGPCSGAFDFGSCNEAMRDVWSSQCGAFWQCLDDQDEGARSSNSNTLTSLSLASRKTRSGANAVSMLATKTIPVDGYKIRNSLYLTQPMRKPAQASVNVLMHEDTSRMYEKSKYKGRKDQTVQLRGRIQDILRLMTATAT